MGSTVSSALGSTVGSTGGAMGRRLLLFWCGYWAAAAISAVVGLTAVCGVEGTGAAAAVAPTSTAADVAARFPDLRAAAAAAVGAVGIQLVVLTICGGTTAAGRVQSRVKF